MNARSTASGTTSVLIEPWRKNLRSSADQLGTWARPGGAGSFSTADSRLFAKTRTPNNMQIAIACRTCLSNVGFMLIDAVIQNAPTGRLLDQNDALGGLSFLLKLCLEKYTDIIAFWHADEFVNICGADKF